MRASSRVLLGALLVAAVAVAGIALNFTLLRLTGDAHDPVGRLSPRAVFFGQTTTAPTSTTTTPTHTDDGSNGSGHSSGDRDGDD